MARLALLVCLAVMVNCNAWAKSEDTVAEPNIEQAMGWWSPQRGVWTPIGWKSHLFRFIVPYNGALVCSPHGMMAKPHTAKYAGDDFQLTFHPSKDGKLPPKPTETVRMYRWDGGHGIQEFDESLETPVLSTRWPVDDGVILKSEVFAHMAGGDEVATAMAPLFAWVRLSVDHVDPIRHPEKYGFAVQLSKAWYLQGGIVGQDDTAFLEGNPARIPLDTPLTSATLAGEAGATPGLTISHRDLTRMLVLPGGEAEVSLSPVSSEEKEYVLYLELPAKVGAHVDLLVPMLREPADVALKEMKLGRAGALAEAEAHWNDKPDTAAEIHTPENYFNQAIRRNIQYAQIIAELNPENGENSFLSGVYGYDTLWSTPTSMISHMFLDLLGYHDVVEKHTALYKANQGSVRPPGPSYKLSNGYFSTPKTLTSIDWLGDHGAIMEIISRHALLSGDKEYIDKWIDPLLKGCEFIKTSIEFTDHDGAKGVCRRQWRRMPLYPRRGYGPKPGCLRAWIQR